MVPNILFVNLPNVPVKAILNDLSFDTFLTLKKSMPLGILYLSSYIKKHNKIGRVGLIDYAANFEQIRACRSIDEFIVRIAHREVNFVPDLILFSLIFSVSHEFCIRAIKLLRRIWPNSTVLVGGIHATNYTEKLLEYEYIDYIARGEGEKGLSEFIEQFSNGKRINVQGIYSKEKINSERPLELCEFIYDLDEIPFPDWDLINMNMYTDVAYIAITGREKEIQNKSKSAVILATRGCPCKCTYCSQHTVHGRQIRYRSIDNVIEEIELLHKRYNVTTFVPNDDMFISQKKRDLELLHLIKELSIPHIEFQFPNGLHSNSMDPAIMDALIGVGTKIVNIAIESGSDYVQKYLIKKNVNLKKARVIVRNFREKGVYVRCFFILGFPGETKEQMQETIDYAKSLEADWFDFFLAIPLLGSEMYDQFVKLGYIKKDEPIWSEVYVLGRNFDTKEISSREIKDLAYRANLECNFINNTNKKNKEYKKAISMFEDIINRYPFHIIAWYSMMECYRELENREKVGEIEERIKELVLTNTLAKDMYNKYNDLMENLKI